MKIRWIWGITLVWAVYGCGNSQSAMNENTETDKNNNNNVEEVFNTSSSDNSENDTPSSTNVRRQAEVALTDFFDMLEKGRYDEMSAIFSSKVEKYITMKNTTPEAITKEVSRFLKGKTKVKYTPEFANLELNNANGNMIVSFPLYMTWSWEEKNPNGGDPYLYQHEASTITEVTFDKNFKIKSYEEKKIIYPKYKLLMNSSLTQDKGAEPIEISQGTTVQGYFLSRSQGGMIERKVLYKEKPYWTIDKLEEDNMFSREGAEEIYLEKIQ